MSGKGKPRNHVKDLTDDSSYSSKELLILLNPEAQIQRIRKIEDDILSPYWAWRTGARPEY